MAVTVDKPEGFGVQASQVIGGRYTVERLLGEGGMGAVYKVRDADGRSLALKRLRVRSGVNASAATLLFQREFYWLAQLAHPRIIEVYDYGVDDQGAYYTMELLDGEDLREGGQLQSLTRKCEVLRDVASALAIVHSRRMVHRDVSPRNIRCTSDGRAKLLDFGAMVPVGMCKQIVGTAVCVAPESIEMLSLDGRADLYSLGVLAYWMLTGRYPYPAHEFSELNWLWETQVVPPAVATPGIPERLSDLVMQLISVDRGARPASAAEVIERLNAIAGLPPEHDAGVETAYLTMPVLVGRDAQVQRVRSYLACLASHHRAPPALVRPADASELPSGTPTPLHPRARANGVAITICGDAGSGRTRMLDMCVLEAKLLGAVVVRACGADASAEYAAVRTIAEQLSAQLPEAAKDAAIPYAAALGTLFQSEPQTVRPSLMPTERRRIQTALRDWIRAIARNHTLMLVIDDFDRIDEPSAALIAALAYDIERRKLALVTARETEANGNLAVTSLEHSGHRIDLQPLSQSEVELLMRSIFGDAELLTSASRRVFDVSRGNPRAVMALLEHLTAQGKVRYAAGRWLFTTLSQSLLPSSLEEATASRVRALPEDARDLAQTLSLTDPSWLNVEDYTELTGHKNVSRMLNAVMMLTQTGIISADGDRYRFAQRASADWIAATLSTERSRELHARLAQVARRRGQAIRLVHHLIDSGHAREGLEVLLRDIGVLNLDRTTLTLRLLERVMLEPAVFDLPVVDRLSIEIRTAGVASILGEYDTFKQYAPDALNKLELGSGLSEFRTLAATQVPEADRLRWALEMAEQRYQATPEGQRLFSVVESIRRIARFQLTFAAMAAAASDRSLVAELPSLEPFIPFTPAIEVIQKIIGMCVYAEEGRFDQATRDAAELLDRLSRPDNPRTADLFKLIHHIAVVQAIQLDATMGIPRALEYAAQLDDVPYHRANAWLGRRTYHRIRGNLELAKECDERAVLLQLQDGMLPVGNHSFRADLVARWWSDDLLGLKGMLDGLEASVAKFPKLYVLRHLAHYHCHRMLGEYHAAAKELAAAQQLAAPCEHRDWCHVAAASIELLTLMGETERALECAQEHQATCEKFEMQYAWSIIGRSYAAALLSTDQLDAAALVLDNLISALDAKQASGILVLRCCDLRARVALRSGDADALQRWLSRCDEMYASTDSPALRFQRDRLRRDAEQIGYSWDAAALEPNGRGSVILPSGLTTIDHVRSAFLNCIDSEERARKALSLLIEHAHARGGYLYRLRAGELTLLSVCGVPAAPNGLGPLLTAFTASLTAGAGDSTTGDLASGMEQSADARVRRFGFKLVPLYSNEEGQPTVVALAVLTPADAVVDVPLALRQAIASELVQLPS